nr:immunoglobulin light chain junction region [Macaca mulatta]
DYYCYSYTTSDTWVF